MQKLKDLKRNELLFNGIYRIINSVNKKDYIGSCAAKDFLYARLLHHYIDLKKGKHCNIYLQNSFNKYGEDVFKFEILEICLPEECIQKEQFWLEKLNPVYNFCKIAGNTLGRVTTQETKDKISISQKIRWKENPELTINMSKLHKGKKRTPEQIEKIRIYNTGSKRSLETRLLMRSKQKEYLKNNPEVIIQRSMRMKNRSISEETLLKMSKSQRKSKGVKIICLDNNMFFESVSDAAEFFNTNKYTIQDILRGKRKNCYNIKRQNEEKTIII